MKNKRVQHIHYNPSLKLYVLRGQRPLKANCGQRAGAAARRRSEGVNYPRGSRHWKTSPVTVQTGR